MEIMKLEKCWIYNELADIPEEYIVIEKDENEKMFDDLQRILERKGWIKKENEPDVERTKKSNDD